jgi:hypothetical protein
MVENRGPLRLRRGFTRTAFLSISRKDGAYSTWPLEQVPKEHDSALFHALEGGYVLIERPLEHLHDHLPCILVARSG